MLNTIQEMVLRTLNTQRFGTSSSVRRISNDDHGHDIKIIRLKKSDRRINAWDQERAGNGRSSAPPAFRPNVPSKARWSFTPALPQLLLETSLGRIQTRHPRRARRTRCCKHTVNIVVACSTSACGMSFRMDGTASLKIAYARFVQF